MAAMKAAMKAALLHGPKDLRIEEVSIPEVGPAGASKVFITGRYAFAGIKQALIDMREKNVKRIKWIINGG